MTRILLLIIFTCIIFASASYAQSSASVLSPSTPTVKFSMADEDQQSNQTTTTKSNPVASTTANKDSKKDDDSDHTTCSRDGCTHHHKKEEPSCKKDEKPEAKPTFMQVTNMPK